MNARTKRRIRETQRVLARLRTEQPFREWLPTDDTPVLVVLHDDTVGFVLDHVARSARDESATAFDARVVMRSPDSLIHSTLVTVEGGEVDTDQLPVAVDSEWGMLVEYVEMEGRAFSLQTVSSGVTFAASAPAAAVAAS